VQYKPQERFIARVILSDYVLYIKGMQEAPHPFMTLKMRYLLVGIWNSIFGVFIFWVLLRTAESLIRYQGVLAVATVLSVCQSHITQRFFVWKSQAPFLPEFFKFGTVYAAQFVANLLLLMLMVEVFEIDVLPAQISITIVLVAIAFVINKKWTFSR
jgi:putative flippase GtrA